MATRDERRAAEREPLINPPTSDPARLQKEASIHHKLRTYEAILALRAGCMPGTDQLLHWARYAMRSSGVLDSRNRSLSSPGRQFVRDLRAWIEAVADLAEQKNVRLPSPSIWFIIQQLVDGLLALGRNIRVFLLNVHTH